ncbi:DUF1343 domain-containing protein [Selenomonas sp. AB3002]|uniref:exo-beta-N-acetylmuramidase NamZ family protein n=1 Tax=Selenomonas sp. AB3002 TaxID=1392502 RepID=UPI001C82C66A
MLAGKRVALFCNQTARIGEEHILDVLLKDGQYVTALFSPEHGIRGDAPAGESVDSGTDPVTGIPILSLYDGDTVMPAKEDMEKFDVLVMDIQDVGLRYYTYYINICDLMEACACYDKEVILLDRPNPNGHYVDGPLLDMSLKSHVGRLPIPTVHGMTLGELMNMAIGEGWLNLRHKPKFTVIPCQNYNHRTAYALPVPPSPNLPNMKAIYLYASLCPFEGTAVSVGRGTEHPFQCFGAPELQGEYSYSFTPTSMKSALSPLREGEICYGADFSQESELKLRSKGMDLSYVVNAYKIFRRQGKGEKFFWKFTSRRSGREMVYFDLLMGQTYVREAIMAGKSAQEISAMWQEDVRRFKKQRRPYLLYE